MIDAHDPEIVPRYGFPNVEARQRGKGRHRPIVIQRSAFSRWIVYVTKGDEVIAWAPIRRKRVFDPDTGRWEFPDCPAIWPDDYYGGKVHANPEWRKLPYEARAELVNRVNDLAFGDVGW